jgi:hypothetical protein
MKKAELHHTERKSIGAGSYDDNSFVLVAKVIEGQPDMVEMEIRIGEFIKNLPYAIVTQLRKEIDDQMP